MWGMQLGLIVCCILLLGQVQVATCIRSRGLWSVSMWSMASGADHNDATDTGSSNIVQKTALPTTDSNTETVLNVEKVPENVVCENGVCSVQQPAVESVDASLSKDNTVEEPVTPETFNLYPALNEEAVEELLKMGWAKEDCIRALNKFRNDITMAAEWLQEEQDKEEVFEINVQNITALGWVADMARAALNETDGNVTEALGILQLEEDNIVHNFEIAVQDMLQNGWEEIVARQALLAQWTLDQRKSLGFNDTFTREHLDTIRPTLKQNNGTRQSLNKKLDDTIPTPSSPTAAAAETVPKAKEAPKKKKAEDPIPAKKEDVVFEVTATNFQKVVLESPVPVLLDVYADWCGPCKQLGPMLEEAAIRAGGMFRVAKLNSDNERSIVESLPVPGLPTVFTVVKGKFEDRFVGMMEGQKIQQFLIRAVTGYGDRVTEKELQDKDFDEISERIANIAGLASISFKKKEKLFQLVSNAMNQEDAFVTNEGVSQPHPAVKVVLAYIDNCRKDILNPKYRVISTTSKAYVEKVRACTAAQTLLEIAGFRAVESNGTVTCDQLQLIHNNAAILSLVGQKINGEIAEKKFAKVKQSSIVLEKKKDPYAVPAVSKTPTTGTTTSGTAADKTVSNKNTAKATTSTAKKTSSLKKDEATLSFRGVLDAIEGSTMVTKKATMKQSMTLKKALDTLLEDEDVKLPSRYVTLEIKYPLPRRSVDAKLLKMKLADLIGEDQSLNVGSVVKTIKPAKKPSKVSKESKFGALFRKKNSKIAPRSTKTNTLHSTGHLNQTDKKHNEYFGGDSTVTLAGEDEDDAEEDQDEEDEAEEDEDEEED